EHAQTIKSCAGGAERHRCLTKSDIAECVREYIPQRRQIDAYRGSSMAIDVANVTVDLSDLFDVYSKELGQPEQTNYFVSPDAIRQIAYSFDDHNALYL